MMYTHVQRRLALLLTAAVLTVCGGEESMLAPWFVEEPAALVRYVTSRGVRVRCAAGGRPPPELAWLQHDGTALHDVPSLRRIYNNGTLEVLPAPDAFEPLATRVRCRASNMHGVTLSRYVTLQPVVDVGWEVQTLAGVVSVGGIAAVSCVVTAHDTRHNTRFDTLITPVAWYRGDSVLHIEPPTLKSRYVVAGNTLLIRDVTSSEAGAYSCLARHALTDTTERARPAHLTVTQSPTNTSPRLLSSGGGGSEVSVSVGNDVCLPCVVADLNQPQYTWYRELDGRLQPVDTEVGARWAWAGGAALCLRRVTTRDAGLWMCKAYNVLGDVTAHITLSVRSTLSVTVTPNVLVADTGSTARFSCSASEGSATLTWLHDGAPAGAGAELLVRGLVRAHRGVYQCLATTHTDNALATAELRLGDASPELHYTFIEQALRPGGDVALRCAASGVPPPRFSWLLDDQPLDQYRAHNRYMISSESSATGDVVSVLNISAVTTTDGGTYTCRAHNERGDAQHSARLNIYGPPSIRALGPVRVVAGANATIYCPYAGYPISSVSWWRRGAAAAVGAGGGRVRARGAALLLSPALPQDGGHYACAVTAPEGPSARRDIDIQVRNPPKISPFMFSSELTEGSSVQVLCGVSSGDKPMYFSWLKDDAPLPPNLQIEEKSLNEFSLLMFSELRARHSGAYTCRVSNHAATVNYTATLTVKVAPSWTTEPLDASVLLGAPLLVECTARGYPTPTVAWYRRIDGVGESGAEQWEEVVGHNGSLWARAAARSHRGLYRCVADNGVGPPLHKHVNITVHEAAHFEGSGGNVSCVRGRSVALACHALGDSPLAVHWTQRGVRLDLTSYRWTVSEVRTASGVRSTLQVRAAGRDDAGEYRCHATNQYGRSEQLMYLHVDEPPDAPQRLFLNGVGTRWVQVSWAESKHALTYTALCTVLRGESPPGASALHTSVNFTLDTTADQRLNKNGAGTLSARVEGLHAAAAYSLRLIASNHVGQSAHSEPLLFTTIEEAPSASPQNVRVRAANSGELHITWSVPPQDTWNGELLGYVTSWRELTRSDVDDDDDGDTESSVSRSGSATATGWSRSELSVTGLRSGARYALTVRAYNRAGAGPPSTTVYAATVEGVPERAPRTPSCTTLSPRMLLVRWRPLSAQQTLALTGYDLHYSPTLPSRYAGRAESDICGSVRSGIAAEATLQGLRAATNYTVWVRARTVAGLGPPSAPVHCATMDDVPEVVEHLSAVGNGPDSVLITWLAPSSPHLTHYTLYTRERDKVGGEWTQRVEAEPGETELWREVRGLRERTVYTLWVRAHGAAGDGPPSRSVTAAPAPPMSARITSLSRGVRVARGSRVRLRCAAVGAPPLHRTWTPTPPAHTPYTLADNGDLLIHKVESPGRVNYTCVAHNSLGSDALSVSVEVCAPPVTPVLRLVRAELFSLRVAWDGPARGGTVRAYTLRWARAGGGGGPERAGGGGGPERARVLPPGDTEHALQGLACGALYRVTLQAHGDLGDSAHSAPLLARTIGDKARAAAGRHCVWANSTALRVNLLAWEVRCAAPAWSVALRPARGAHRDTWLRLHTDRDGELAEANNLRPGSWYEVRVEARSPPGDTVALYRAATRTATGERVGEVSDVPVAPPAPPAPPAPWHAPLAPALLAAALALLLAALAGLLVVRSRCRAEDTCLRRACSLQGECHPHPQLYTTEPTNRGKIITPPDVPGDVHEISPYATFSMSGESGSAGGCALHLRTFGRAETLSLAVPPPRPNLLQHNNDYRRPRDSDSDSSSSPCAACARASELYRVPAARLADTLPAVDSSADDTSYSAGGKPRRPTARYSGRPRPRREPRQAPPPAHSLYT